MGTHVVVIVHGTWASAKSDKSSGSDPVWWSAEGRLANQIRSNSPGCDVEPFRWSGRNSEADRRRAASDLRGRIAQLESSTEVESVSIVAHSHGGSIVWMALCGAPPFAKLRSIVTVGTPFLQFGASHTSLALAIPAMIGGLLFAHNLSMVPMIVREASSVWARGDGWTLVAMGLLAVVLMSLVVHCSVRVGLWIRAQSRALRFGRAARASWTHYAGRWHFFVSSEDEAIGGLSRAAIAAAPRLFRSPEPEDVTWGWRLLRRLRSGFNLIQRVLDEAVWSSVVRRSMGSDVHGEVIRFVSAHPVESPIIRNALTFDSDQSVVMRANAGALEAVRSLRNRLARVDITRGVVSTAWADLNTDANVLVHTNYFTDDPPVSSIVDSALCAQTDARLTAFSGNSDDQQSSLRIRVRRSTPLILVATLALVLSSATLVTAWIFELLFQDRVYAHTREALIERRIADAPTTDARALSDLRAVREWMRALALARGPEVARASLGAIVKIVRSTSRDASDSSALADAAMIAGEVGIDETVTATTRRPPVRGAILESDDWVHRGRVALLLARADLIDSARSVIDDSRGGHAYEYAEAVILASIQRAQAGDAPLGYWAMSGGEDSPDSLITAAIDHARFGDVEIADALLSAAEVAARDQGLDFAEMDDVRTTISDAAAEVIQAIASARGRETAQSFRGRIESMIDSTPGGEVAALLFPTCVGLIAAGDWDDALAEALDVADSEVAIRRRCLVHIVMDVRAPLEIRRKATGHALDLLRGADQMERVLGYTVLCNHWSETWPRPADVAKELVAILSADIDQDPANRLFQRGSTLRRLVVEGRIDEVLDAARSWSSAPKDVADLASDLARQAMMAGDKGLAEAIVRAWIAMGAEDDRTAFVSKIAGGQNANPDAADDLKNLAASNSRRAWRGDATVLVEAADLKLIEYFLIYHPELFRDAGRLVEAAERLHPESRIRVFRRLAEHLESRGDVLHSEMVWRRLGELARSEGDVSAERMNARELAALGRARVGDEFGGRQLADGLAPSAKLRLCAVLLERSVLYPPRLLPESHTNR